MGIVMVMGAVGWGVGSLHGEDEPRADGVLRALVGEGRVILPVLYSPLALHEN